MNQKHISAILEAAVSQQAFFVYIASVLLALPTAELLSQNHEMIYLTQPVIMEIAGIIGIAMVLCSLFIKKRFAVSDILLGLVLVFALVSLLLSEDIAAPFRSENYGSSEWLTHLMAYISLAYAASSLEDMRLKKKLITVLTAAAVIQLIPALLQTVGSEFAYCYYDGDFVTRKQLPYGLTQHYVWFTALAGMLTCFASSKALLAEKREGFLAYGALTLLGFYTLFSSDTWLSLLDVGVIILFLAAVTAIFARKDKAVLRTHLKRLGALILAAGAALLLCIGVMGRFENGPEGSVPPPVKEYEKETASRTISLDRSQLWDYGFACLPDHWAFGVGFDNYRWCFTHAESLAPAEPQSKAQSEAVYLLVTRGAFALAVSAALVIYAAASGTKRLLRSDDSEERIVTAVFLGMFTVYTVQALFNSSAVNIAPYYWAALGMLLTRSGQSAPKTERGAEQ